MDQIIKLMTEQVTELLNCQKYFKISDDMLMELASNGVFSIYHIWEKDEFRNWAKWYALYWTWNHHELTEESFEKTTEKEWLSWIKEDQRFYLGSDGRVYEHDWQTEWKAAI